jgi:integrase
MSLAEKYGKSVLSIEEVAAELGGSTSEVESLIKSGDLAAKKIGERIIIPVHSLDKYLGNDSLAESIDQRYTTEPTNIEEMEGSNLDQISGGSILYVKARDVYRYAISNGKDPVTGKRNRIVKGDFHSREEAQAALQKALDAMSVVHSPVPAAGVMPVLPTAPTNINRPQLTVREFLDKNLFIMFSAPTPRTADCYANAAKLLVKSIGDMKLCDLTRTNLQETLNRLAGMSQSSIDKVRLVIKKFTEFATEEGLIPIDVGRKIKKVKSTKIDLRSDDEKIYSKAQISTILACAREESDPMLLTVLTTLALTGMRPEELRGLEKRDVHSDTQEISIRQAATMKPKITLDNALAKSSGSREAVIGRTKTPAGIRSLFIGKHGMEVLRKWLDYLKNDPIKYESRFLFPSTSDAPMRDDVLNTKFTRFKQRHGLDKEYSLYRFRHTFCTNLAEANVPIKTAMRLMGDSTTNVVLGVYTHVRTDEARRAGEKINQVYVDMLVETDKSDDEEE